MGQDKQRPHPEDDFGGYGTPTPEQEAGPQARVMAGAESASGQPANESEPLDADARTGDPDNLLPHDPGTQPHPGENPIPRDPEIYPVPRHPDEIPGPWDPDGNPPIPEPGFPEPPGPNIPDGDVGADPS